MLKDLKVQHAAGQGVEVGGFIWQVLNIVFAYRRLRTLRVQHLKSVCQDSVPGHSQTFKSVLSERIELHKIVMV